MREKEIQITPPHPLLVEIRATIADIEAACALVGQLDGNVAGSWDYLSPGKWTAQVEAAVDKPAELESLRVQYDEATVTYMCRSAALSGAWSRFMDLRMQIVDRIKALLELHDSLTSTSPDRWLQPLLRSAIVAASNAHYADPKRTFSRGDSDRQAGKRCYQILVDVFGRFAEEFGQIGDLKNYPEGPAVQGRKYKSILNPDVDFRHVHPVEFEDCCNDKHPHNERLAGLLKELELAQQQATQAMKLLKEQNGEINERQHANRMIDLMHGATGCGAIKDPKGAIGDQNLRRAKYESARQVVYMTLSVLAQRQLEVFDTLRAAIAEARPLIDHTVQTVDIVTVDKPRTAIVIMINCLAADLRLRRVARELRVMWDVYHEDVSGGAGRLAVDAQFQVVAQRYRAVSAQ